MLSSTRYCGCYTYMLTVHVVVLYGMAHAYDVSSYGAVRVRSVTKTQQKREPCMLFITYIVYVCMLSVAVTVLFFL